MQYGLTPQGPQIKHRHEILEEMHTELSQKWGVNTRQNPHSYLNAQLTAFAEQIAQLWAFGEMAYFAMYPYSAENADLDKAVQYGGITRNEPRKTIYQIHATAIDGTIIPQGAAIRSTTNPSVDLACERQTEISRHNFNTAVIRFVETARLPDGQAKMSTYTIILNGEQYNYSGQNPQENLAKILTENEPNFAITINENFLQIQANDQESANLLTLSANMTTETITSVVNFTSPEYGELILPIGTITQIITSVVGLLDVENRLPHIAGRLLENDIGLRKSYIDKIYLRSANMVESIESAIWQNVQGVQSVRGFQNDTHLWDEYGRPPHSVELVVMGGSNRQIAQQIWQAKAAGIQTHGNVESFVTANENETVLIKFTRPQPVYIWYKIELTLDASQILPPNYVQAIQETITERLQTAKPGQNISSQRLFVHHLHEKIPGIAYIATSHFATVDIKKEPEKYTTGLVEITPRQLAFTEPSKIEVLING